MKDILFDPLFLPIILAIGLIYLGVIFTLTSHNKKLVSNLEKVAVILFIFTMYGVDQEPFARLHPQTLSEYGKTLPSAAVQLAVYAALLFILLPRLRYTLKDIFPTLSLVILNNPFLCFLLLMVGLSFLWSETPIETLKLSLVLIGTSTISAYIGKQYNWQELDFILRWVGAAIVLLSLVNRNPVAKGWCGILGHPNQLGAAISLIATLWIWHGTHHPKQRWLALGILGVCFVLLQNTNSAGAKVQLFVLISLLIYLRFVKSLSSQWAFVAVVLFLLLVSIAAILITENMEAIVVDTLGKDLTFTGRRPLWELLWHRKIKSHLWLGYGYASFWQRWRGLDNPAQDVVFGNGWRALHAHNGFMEILLALGLVGFILFVLSLLTTLARAVMYMSQTKRPESILPLVLLTYLLVPNLSLSRLLETGDTWCYYILAVIRLSLDTREMNFSENKKIEAPTPHELVETEEPSS
ncbi:MAG TPA: O-antigen polymerase [Cyanobacteria bacterium UBA8803]|nr:O-antigen polymerase [Cyanobacteria bacterium UBA9273]HBL62822.1 O-antigen polymerase [Cyanobacteria bacterium UBA8803]